LRFSIGHSVFVTRPFKTCKTGGIYLNNFDFHFHKTIRLKKLYGLQPSLIVYFIIIIIACTLVTGILSYRIIGSYITDRTIASNSKLLSQYKSSMDSILVDQITGISSKIIYDINTNIYLNKYFSSPVKGNIADIYNVSRYLTDMSISNSLINSLSIYYIKNNLLISTDYIRHTLYKAFDKQPELKHYHNIVQKAAYKSPETLSFIFDYGFDSDSKASGYSKNTESGTLIHAVRLIYGYDKNIIGAVVATIGSNIFKEVLNEFTPEELGSIFIIDSEGLILSHTDNKHIGQNISSINYSKKLLDVSNRSGYFISTIESIPTVVSYQQSEFNNWRYISVAPIKNISFVKNNIFIIMMLTSFLSLLVGLIISFAAAKKLAKPFQSIADYCRKKHFTSKEMNSKNEYTLISNTINNLESIVKEKDKKFNYALPILKVNFLSALLSDNPPEIAEISSRMKMLGINLPYKYFCTAVIKLKKNRDSEKVIQYECEKLNVCSQVEEMFTTVTSTCLLYERDNILSILINFDSDEDVIYKLGKKFIEKSHRQEKDTILVLNCLSFGIVCTNLYCIGASYNVAINGLNYSYVFPERNFFISEDTISLDQKRSFSNKLLINNLDNSFKSLNYKKCMSDLDRIIKTLRSGNYSYHQVYTTLVTCLGVTENFVYTNSEKELDLHQGFKNTINIFEYREWLKEIIERAFESVIYEDLPSESNNLVKRAKELIEKNIKNSQLSLEYIADELGISYKHLSKVFKNKTGVKFIDYLTNLRLNHSRNLLINTNLKVQEISDIMGYSTPQYFISKFKLMFGCTPNKYRNLKSSGHSS